MAWFLHQVIVPVFVIGVLVIVHELGHFLVAKLCRVGVVKFAIGFGPALYRFRRRETTYQIGLIPFGGFVRMVGDIPDMVTGGQATDEAVRGGEMPAQTAEPVSPELEAAMADRSRWFIEKNFWQRSAIVIAGPLFNYILAVLLAAVAVFCYGVLDLSEEARIGAVMNGSPAQQAGLLAGDYVEAIDARTITSWSELAQTVHEGSGAPITLKLRRANEELELTVQPKLKEMPGLDGTAKQVYLIGIEPTTIHIPVSFLESCSSGWTWTLRQTAMTYTGLWGMLTGKVSPKDLAGPLFIIDAAGKQSREGFDRLLYFVALLSVSLAVLNLLPIPILDGGHLLFFVIEALCGPISMRKKELAQQVGMLLLLSLMVFAIRNDIVRDRDVFKKTQDFADVAPAPSVTPSAPEQPTAQGAPAAQESTP